MMQSMTGYGSAEKQTKNFQVKVEIKSLNGKFLEVNLRVPKILSEKEIELRRYFTSVLNRGSVLCILSVDRGQNVSYDVNLNKKLAKAYYDEMKVLADELEASDKDLMRTVLTMPDVLKADDGLLEAEDWDEVLKCCEQAVAVLNEFRTQEGSELHRLLESHNQAIMEALPLIDPLIQQRKTALRDRLKSGLEELSANVNSDDNRLEQEMIYYLEKLDVSEEQNRLKSHCQMFVRELSESQNGKKLGFISQEMGREINTLGSKANFAPIQEIVIGMKEELEKIKEQSLNVL
jgi:uncharacterized protein (TIGR00255 family)